MREGWWSYSGAAMNSSEPECDGKPVLTPGVSGRVSVVIPTLNSAATLAECLQSVMEQEFPRDRVEIVVADAGSSDATLDIARRFDVDVIVPNPLRTGEAGKSAGVAACTGEFIALVDSDNVLDGPDWLLRMTAPFEDASIVAAEPLHYTRRASDPALTRYFAMLGMSDPLCLFLGNYDRFSHVSGTWTGLSVAAEDFGDYLKLTLNETALPTIGANGFVCRRSLMASVSWAPYFFDIDIVQQSVAAGHRHIAKVKNGIVHLYGRSLADFARKQDRRIRDFLFFSAQRNRTYPWDRQRKAGIGRFVLATVLVVPLLVQAMRGALRRPDRAWWLHVPACWITLWVYGWASLRNAVGLRTGERDRSNWKQ